MTSFAKPKTNFRIAKEKSPAAESERDVNVEKHANTKYKLSVVEQLFGEYKAAERQASLQWHLLPTATETVRTG